VQRLVEVLQRGFHGPDRLVQTDQVHFEVIEDVVHLIDGLIGVERRLGQRPDSLGRGSGAASSRPWPSV
jgi:hypothetical protein